MYDDRLRIIFKIIGCSTDFCYTFCTFRRLDGASKCESEVYATDKLNKKAA